MGHRLTPRFRVTAHDRFCTLHASFLRLTTSSCPGHVARRNMVVEEASLPILPHPTRRTTHAREIQHQGRRRPRRRLTPFSTEYCAAGGGPAARSPLRFRPGTPQLLQTELLVLCGVATSGAGTLARRWNCDYGAESSRWPAASRRAARARLRMRRSTLHTVDREESHHDRITWFWSVTIMSDSRFECRAVDFNVG